jgi:hypothetical protein
MAETALTPPDLAKRLGVNCHKILLWIASGELQAVNVATRPTGQPRWRITPAAIEAFELRRSSQPAPRQTRRHRTRSPEIKEFFR